MKGTYTLKIVAENGKMNIKVKTKNLDVFVLLGVLRYKLDELSEQVRSDMKRRFEPNTPKGKGGKRWLT